MSETDTKCNVCGEYHANGACEKPMRASELAPATGSVDFECEACGLQGEVDAPKHMESVSCPECNARYLYWPENINFGGKTPWKCVVRPVFVPPNAKVSGGD